jgi:hypothetical protein
MHDLRCAALHAAAEDDTNLPIPESLKISRAYLRNINI